MAQDVKINIGATDAASGVIKRVNTSLGSLNSTLKVLSGAAIVAGLNQVADAIAKVGRAALEYVNEFSAYGDKLYNLSQRTKLSIETLSELSFVAEQAGTDIEQLGQAVFRAFRRIGNAQTGTGPAARAVKELGLNMKELKELSPEDTFIRLVDALNEVEDVNRRSQMGFEIFGDNWRQLVPLIEQGSDAIENLMGKARDLGTMTSEQAKLANEWTNATNELKFAIQGLRNEIVSEYAPALNAGAKAATDFFVNLRTEGSITEIAVSGTLESIVDQITGPWLRRAFQEAFSADPEIIELAEDAGMTYGEAIVAGMNAAMADGIQRAAIERENAIEEIVNAGAEIGGVMLPVFQGLMGDQTTALEEMLERQAGRIGGIQIPMFDFAPQTIGGPAIQANESRLMRGGGGLSPAAREMQRLNRTLDRNMQEVQQLLGNGVPVRIIENQADEDAVRFERVD